MTSLIIKFNYGIPDIACSMPTVCEIAPVLGTNAMYYSSTVKMIQVRSKLKNMSQWRIHVRKKVILTLMYS